MPLTENTQCLTFLAPVQRSTCVDAKLRFSLHSQTESLHKVQLLQNIFIINYILYYKC